MTHLAKASMQTNSHGLCLRIASNIWETFSLDLFCCRFELYSGVWKRDLPLFAWTVGHLGRCQQRLIHCWCQVRVDSGKRFGVAWVHRQHLHDCLTFMPTPSMQCVALLTFQLKCREMSAYQRQAMGRGWEDLQVFCMCILICHITYTMPWYVTFISQLRCLLSLEGDLEQIETTRRDAQSLTMRSDHETLQGWGFLLWQEHAKRWGAPGGVPLFPWWGFGCVSGNRDGNGNILASRWKIIICPGGL